MGQDSGLNWCGSDSKGDDTGTESCRSDLDKSTKGLTSLVGWLRGHISPNVHVEKGWG